MEMHWNKKYMSSRGNSKDFVAEIGQ